MAQKYPNEVKDSLKYDDLPPEAADNDVEWFDWHLSSFDFNGPKTVLGVIFRELHAALRTDERTGRDIARLHKELERAQKSDNELSEYIRELKDGIKRNRVKR